MKEISWTCFAAVLLLWPWAAAADDAETLAMRRVRLTTDAAHTKGCSRLGTVRDDSVKDMRRKIVRGGGNTAVLAFGVADLSMIYADVFYCPPQPAEVPLPPNVPPPPPGPPPPPPPGSSPPS
jgi:hypothetical protein